MKAEETRERVVLIGIGEAGVSGKDKNYKWVELVELAKTAGAVEVGRVTQARANPDPATFLGSGKAEFVAETVRSTDADLVISLQDLSPVQVRNLEEITGVKVIDRTALILDIFAQRAQTREGKLQVELAQLEYLLPRLSNSGRNLSRLGGGIGTRGPGETKLEIDRRRVRQRIADLRKELTCVATHRFIQRHQRENNKIPTISLIGYTNAGKSTLFNRLTAAGVSSQNRLFDTLDPISRRLELSNQYEVVMLDTVGFISDLPHQLVAAFKATLEETVHSTILLQVLDASSLDLEEQYQAVQQVLMELKISAKERISVLNKTDLIPSPNTVTRLSKEWGAIPISATTGEGIPELIAEILKHLTASYQTCRILLPFSEARLLEKLHHHSRVLEEVFTEKGIKMLVEMEAPLALQFQRFFLTEE